MTQLAFGGLNFELTDEQQMLQKMARDFAAQEIIPQAEHFDRTAEFPIDIINKGRQIGLVNLNIPKNTAVPARACWTNASSARNSPMAAPASAPR